MSKTKKPLGAILGTPPPARFVIEKEAFGAFKEFAHEPFVERPNERKPTDTSHGIVKCKNCGYLLALNFRLAPHVVPVGPDGTYFGWHYCPAVARKKGRYPDRIFTILMGTDEEFKALWKD